MELGNWCELGGLVVRGFWVASPSVLPRSQNFRYLQIWGLGRTVQFEQEKNRCCDDQSRGYPHRHSGVLHSGTVHLIKVSICASIRCDEMAVVSCPTSVTFISNIFLGTSCSLVKFTTGREGIYSNGAHIENSDPPLNIT